MWQRKGQVARSSAGSDQVSVESHIACPREPRSRIRLKWGGVRSRGTSEGELTPPGPPRSRGPGDSEGVTQARSASRRYALMSGSLGRGRGPDPPGSSPSQTQSTISRWTSSPGLAYAGCSPASGTNWTRRRQRPSISISAELSLPSCGPRTVRWRSPACGFGPAFHFRSSASRIYAGASRT
jgi:hypothetical protein